jgi:hypothetical protein
MAILVLICDFVALRGQATPCRSIHDRSSVTVQGARPCMYDATRRAMNPDAVWLRSSAC